jgi:selenide,water dikinase
VIDGALDAIELGCIPGGLEANREFAECVVREREGAAVDADVRTLLFDPQTAGGLLISVRAGHATAMVDELQNAGYPDTRVVGEVLDGAPRIVLF